MKKIILMIVSLTLLLTICNANPLINNTFIDLGNFEKPKFPILDKSTQWGGEGMSSIDWSFGQDAKREKALKIMIILLIIIIVTIIREVIVTNRRFVYRYNDEIIEVKTTINSAELIVNDKLQDRKTGMFSKTLQGKSKSGEDINVQIGSGAFSVICNLRVGNEAIKPQ